MELRDRQDERWALLSQAGSGPRGLALFVHGFGGDHLTTWGRLPELLSVNAPAEPSLEGWDFLFLGYSTAAVQSYLDIASRIATECELALQGRQPYQQPYARLALFGHSLGALGIRQLLCASVLHPPSMLEMLKSVVLFGVPQNGSPWAAYVGVLSPIAAALEPANPQLRMLHEWHASVHAWRPWPQVQLVIGLEDKVVATKYAQLIEFVGDRPLRTTVSLGHLKLVKPSSWNGSIVRDIIVDALK